jgi:uncharacterized protein (DUF362 family)
MSGLAALTAGPLFSKRAAGAELSSSVGRKKRKAETDHDLVSVKGEDPYKMTVEAVKALGGMEKFVRRGDVVVVKPNIGWDRTPEQAANTNPFVVAALVALAYEAGAKRVNVFDRTCNSAERCYAVSGIKKAAEEKGAKVYFVDDWNFVKAKFPYESPMEGWPVYRDALECDTLINVPVLKDHGLTGLTLSMKNLMGVCGSNRGQIHNGIGRKLVDITDFMSPELTVIDGYRVLTAHGPTGGDLKDVVSMKRIIASADPTLADCFAANLAGRDPFSIPYIEEAARRGFGNTDVSKADILEITV